MKKACVIGDGGWGTALAMVLSSNGFDVTVWGPFQEYIDSVKSSGENVNFLPGVELPVGLKWSADRAEATAGADIVVLAVPTKYFRETVGSFKGILPESAHIVCVAKGIDMETHGIMTEVAEEVLAISSVSALSGPSHAEEVARGIPTAVTIASADSAEAEYLQSAFSNSLFRVYSSSDITGVELGGALKNVIAIAVGVSDGLGYGDNTRAALITRGLTEMTRLGCALGADAATFSGLSGMGDLIVTCTSRHSRNRSVGERLGRGESIDSILASMKQAAEGVWNCASARALAESKGIEVPITDEVYEIIHCGKDPRDAVTSLLSRDVKPEQAHSSFSVEP